MLADILKFIVISYKVLRGRRSKYLKWERPIFVFFYLRITHEWHITTDTKQYTHKQYYVYYTFTRPNMDVFLEVKIILLSARFVLGKLYFSQKRRNNSDGDRIPVFHCRQLKHPNAALKWVFLPLQFRSVSKGCFLLNGRATRASTEVLPPFCDTQRKNFSRTIEYMTKTELVIWNFRTPVCFFILYTFWKAIQNVEALVSLTFFKWQWQTHFEPPSK